MFPPFQWRRNEFESGGGTDPAQSAGKIIFGRAPPLFGSKSTISRFGTRGAPRAQTFVKVGARALVPYEVGANAPFLQFEYGRTLNHSVAWIGSIH